MKKTILITGSSGQLGSSLGSYLFESFNIISTSRTGKQNFLKLDVTDKKNVNDVINTYNPDVIINCSAITDVDFCENNHLLCRKVNTEGLYNLIKFSKKNVKIIQISTDYIYNGKNGPYSEDDPTHPLNFYGKSKLEAENILIGSNKEYLIIRVNGLYSYDFDFNNFLSWLYVELKNNKSVEIVDDQISNPCYIEFLSNIIMKCIVMNTNGIFNYGSSNFLSRYDFALEFCKVFGFSEDLIKPISTNKLNQIAKRPLKSGLLTDKIQNILGIKTYDTGYCLNNLKNRLNMF